MQLICTFIFQISLNQIINQNHSAHYSDLLFISNINSQTKNKVNTLASNSHFEYKD